MPVTKLTAKRIKNKNQTSRDDPVWVLCCELRHVSLFHV